MQRGMWGCVLGLWLLALTAMPAMAEETPSTLPVGEIERIVRDYLMREPEVLYDALQQLQQQRQAAQAEQQKTVIAARRDAIFDDPDDAVAGDADGKVTLVEFFDYHCGYCRSMMPSINAMIDKESSLRFVFKEYPILGPESVVASKAALASMKQGRYRDMHVALMSTKDLSMSGVLTVAGSLGLDVPKLVADMESPAVQQQIDQNQKLAQALGINGTPSFLVGDTLIPGAIPIGQLAQLIAAERNAAD